MIHHPDHRMLRLSDRSDRCSTSAVNDCSDPIEDLGRLGTANYGSSCAIRHRLFNINNCDHQAFGLFRHHGGTDRRHSDGRVSLHRAMRRLYDSTNTYCGFLGGSSSCRARTRTDGRHYRRRGSIKNLSCRLILHK